MAKEIEWTLSDDQRRNTVNRVAANIATLLFSKGQQISDADAHRAAGNAEKKAYTVAQVEAQTTTGNRPHTETYEAYTRKLAALVLEVIKHGVQQATPANHHDNTEFNRIDLTGERNFLTRESTQEALAAMLSPGSQMSQIKFSTKSFGTQAAEVAAEGIENVSGTLVDADISDIIAGRPEKEVLGALEIIGRSLAKAKLRSLDLSDNALGQKGILACAAAFKDQPALQELAVQNVGCSVNACKSLAELVQHAQELRILRLYNNMSDDAGAKSIAEILSRAPKLEYFRMGSSRVGPEGGIALATSMTAGKCLQQLDLSDNPLTGEVAKSLAQMLRSQPHLRILNLNDTSLEDEGITTIAEALVNTAGNLEELELALNEMTATGAKALARALADKSKLRKLNVRENELEDPGAIALSKAVQALPGLQSLDLYQNQLRRAGAMAIVKAIAGKDQFQSLNLDANEISEGAVDDIKALLNKSGQALVLGELEENDPDAADDDDEEEDEPADEDADSLVDSVTNILQKTGLTS